MKPINKKWLNSLSDYRLELMIESHQKTIDENLIHDELKTFFLSEIKVVKAILKKRGADEI